MIGKIIALVIAMLFLVAAPVYGSIANPASAIDFGAGDGESEVIATADDLKAVLESIPALGDYLDNESILDVNENFKSFTMVEDGYSRQESKGHSSFDDDQDDETRKIDTYTITQLTNSHVLEICFAVEGLYYHVVGEIETLVTHYEDSDCTDTVGRTKNVKSFDAEIFYSSEEILLKYNDYDIKDYVTYGVHEDWEVVEPDLEKESDRTQQKSLEMVEKVFGKWMEVEVPEQFADVDLEAGPDIDPNLPPEEQYKVMIDFSVLVFCNTFSTIWIDEITTSTEINCNYLRNLSNFITGSLATAFNNSGNSYTLKSGDDAAVEYLTGIGIPSDAYDIGYSDAYCSFNVNSTDVTLTQYADLDSAGNGNGWSMYTVTTFKNVNNTVAGVKDADVDTVYNTFYEPVKALMEELMAEEAN